MRHRCIIVPLVALLQLLLLITPAHANIAAMNSGGAMEGSEIVGSVNAVGNEIATLPVRVHKALHLHCNAPVRRPHGTLRIRPTIPVGNVPRFLAPYLLVSFLRHSVLLI